MQRFLLKKQRSPIFNSLTFFREIAAIERLSCCEKMESLIDLDKGMNKGRVLKIIEDALFKDERVVFAYAFGSFLKDEAFRDIDIGIYVKDSQADPFVINSDLKTEVSRLAKQNQLDLDADQFDIRVVNDAPFTFLFRVFTEGKLLLDRDPDLRTDVIEQVSLKYRECSGLLAEASLL